MDREQGAKLQVSVKYYNIVADFLGRQEEKRAVSAGTTIRDFVAALAGESASLRRLAFTAEGKVSGHLRLFRNGQAVLDLDEPLAANDEIRVFPTISGG
jgi:molybdopterin converting factor small subunit